MLGVLSFTWVHELGGHGKSLDVSVQLEDAGALDRSGCGIGPSSEKGVPLEREHDESSRRAPRGGSNLVPG
jgi:hypothetical protein